MRLTKANLQECLQDKYYFIQQFDKPYVSLTKAILQDLAKEFDIELDIY